MSFGVHTLLVEQLMWDNKESDVLRDMYIA